MQKQSNNEATLQVIARAPFHVYYQGEARVLSAVNAVGAFDILPGHADFFSVISAGEVVIDTEKEQVKFEIDGGILTVRDNTAMLFVNV